MLNLTYLRGVREMNPTAALGRSKLAGLPGIAGVSAVISRTEIRSTAPLIRAESVDPFIADGIEYGSGGALNGRIKS
jgi:hypothetical protein